MALSIRTQIIQVLKTALEGITEANGYSFTTRAVYPIMPNDALLDSEMNQPCIFIWPGVESKKLTENIGGVDSELDIHLVCSGQTCYNAADIGAEMAADIDKLLLTGTPFNVGGALVNVEPVDCYVATSDLEEFQPGAYIQYVAKFCTVIGDPRTAWITY